MNCVNRQQLKGFCLIHDQDNFSLKTSSALTTKHIERNLNSCCCIINGVVWNPKNIAPTKNRLDAKEAELVPPIFWESLTGWT